MRAKMSLIFILSIFLIMAGCSKEMTIPNEKDWPVEDFSFIDQNGNTVTRDDLKGKVWIADFVFTNCTTVCLPMTSNMKKLQDQMKEEGLKNVEIISFSVDPKYDKPDVLKKYGENFKVDFQNWRFLTGYTQKEIEEFAKNSFKAHVMKPETSDQVIHSTDFFLVNQEGTIVQYYSGAEETPFEEIIQHIKILQSK